MSTFTTIYLIRHSEQLKVQNKILTNENSQIANEKIILSANGEKMAQQMSQIEELQQINIVFSSNYVRAISTAKYIANTNNLDIIVDENLNERKLRRLN